MSEIHLRKYGVSAIIPFPLYEVDGVDLRVDAAHASGDTTIMKDEGAEVNTTNGFIDEGKGYSITLTATEMQAARIEIYVVDLTATKVWLDRTLIIESYGNASAQHAIDLDDSVRAGLTALPNAAADAIGGLPISDAGGLDLDTKLANTNEITVARMGALTDWLNGGRLDLLLDAIPTTPMRGTDSAALASVATEARLAELDAANLPADIAAIPTTAMRGTDSAALASVATETRLAELDPANLPADIAAIPTTAMRGTDGANTTVPDPAGTAATLHGVTDGKIDTMQIDVTEILNYESGDWEIVNNQMIFKIAGGAEIDRFDLTKAGVPDSDSPDKRVRV